MNYFKKIFTLVIWCLVIPISGSFAQSATDFTDQEYAEFVSINLEIIPVQQEAQQEMVKAISDAGLKPQRFQELVQAQRAGNLTDVIDSQEEVASFNVAGQKVLAVQKDMQMEIQESINESQMSMERFQEFSMAYNQSQEVKSKVDQLLAEEMRGG